jgi:uncharacterized protein (DUF3820 family)
MFNINVPIQYGRYKGTPWRNLPVDYLKWIVEVRAQGWRYAKEALEKATG